MPVSAPKQAIVARHERKACRNTLKMLTVNDANIYPTVEWSARQ
jgi:hypothetical protein